MPYRASSPGQLIFRTLQCRVSIPNRWAILIDWLCLASPGTYIWDQDGRLQNDGWLNLSSDECLIGSTAVAQRIMEGSTQFCPLPESIQNGCALVTIPSHLSREWAAVIKDFCRHYMMSAGRYKMLCCAKMMEVAQMTISDSIIRESIPQIEATWSLWQPSLMEASRKAAAAIARQPR